MKMSMILVALYGVIKQYLVEKFVERQLRVREASGGSNFFGWKWLRNWGGQSFKYFISLP